jgi:hypothetical protein
LWHYPGVYADHATVEFAMVRPEAFAAALSAPHAEAEVLLIEDDALNRQLVSELLDFAS